MGHQFYIGISGGHSRTIAIAFDTKRQMLSGRFIGRALNLHRLDSGNVTERLDSILYAIARRLGFQDVPELRKSDTFLAFALPGAGRALDQKKAAEKIQFAGWTSDRYLILDDTWAGLYEVTTEFPCLCAFSGSGASVAYARRESDTNDFEKLDGWGPIIGDFGSGFDLVRRFFRSIRRQLDVNPTLCPSLLRKVIDQHPAIKGPDNIQDWVDRVLREQPLDWPAELASIAKVLREAAEDNDDFARSLVEITAKDMAETIRLAIDRFDAQNCTLVLQGGMFAFSRIYRDFVLTQLKPLHAGKVLNGDIGPALGALLYALRSEPDARGLIQNRLGSLSAA